jgi:hypothetical protein
VLYPRCGHAVLADLPLTRGFPFGGSDLGDPLAFVAVPARRFVRGFSGLFGMELIPKLTTGIDVEGAGFAVAVLLCEHG